MSKDKRVDAYIAKAQPFAQPILNHIREVVHNACPDCEEKMKWSFPHFDYKGSMMCSMAAFKEHAAFSFWKAALLDDPKKILSNEEAMGHMGRLTKVSDLPSDKILTGFIKQAMKLNEEGMVVAKPKSAPKPPPEIPADLAAALKKNKAAAKCFAEFSPSAQREYVDWLTEAKTDATREKRLETAIEWIAEGKIRNWKYLRK